MARRFERGITVKSIKVATRHGMETSPRRVFEGFGTNTAGSLCAPLARWGWWGWGGLGRRRRRRVGLCSSLVCVFVGVLHSTSCSIVTRVISVTTQSPRAVGRGGHGGSRTCGHPSWVLPPVGPIGALLPLPEGRDGVLSCLRNGFIARLGGLREAINYRRSPSISRDDNRR